MEQVACVKQSAAGITQHTVRIWSLANGKQGAVCSEQITTRSTQKHNTRHAADNKLQHQHAASSSPSTEYGEGSMQQADSSKQPAAGSVQQAMRGRMMIVGFIHSTFEP